jgi:hypothetical protein
MARANNIALVLAFLATLTAPAAASLLHWNPMDSIDENRKLAPRPEGRLWSSDALRRVPALTQSWEKYFADHFGLRKLLIGSYRLATLSLLHTSPHPAVVIGRSDGERRWLYYDAAANADGVGFASLLGKSPYLPGKLASVMAQLRQVAAFVRARGTQLVIVVCPDKQSVYPEYLPPSHRPSPRTLSRLDQFYQAAARLPDVPLIDLRPALLAAKADEQLYYPSDTHWNWKAGLIAYREIARALKARDPARDLLPIDGMTWSLGPPRVGDLTKLMGVPAIGGDRSWLPDFPGLAAQAGPKRGKLLVVGDSFFEYVGPYFDMQFLQVKRIYMGWHKPQRLMSALLDSEKPDVVILESVERYWSVD